MARIPIAPLLRNTTYRVHGMDSTGRVLLLDYQYVMRGTTAFKLEKWFPLQGERAQSLKVFNIYMLGFKTK